MPYTFTPAGEVNFGALISSLNFKDLAAGKCFHGPFGFQQRIFF